MPDHSKPGSTVFAGIGIVCETGSVGMKNCLQKAYNENKIKFVYNPEDLHRFYFLLSFREGLKRTISYYRIHAVTKTKY